MKPLEKLEQLAAKERDPMEQKVDALRKDFHRLAALLIDSPQFPHERIWVSDFRPWAKDFPTLIQPFFTENSQAPGGEELQIFTEPESRAGGSLNLVLSMSHNHSFFDDYRVTMACMNHGHLEITASHEMSHDDRVADKLNEKLEALDPVDKMELAQVIFQYAIDTAIRQAE